MADVSDGNLDLSPGRLRGRITCRESERKRIEGRPFIRLQLESERSVSREKEEDARQERRTMVSESGERDPKREGETAVTTTSPMFRDSRPHHRAIISSKRPARAYRVS